MKTAKSIDTDHDKINDQAQNTAIGEDDFFTVNLGLLINDDVNSLKVGEGRATLPEDFLLREEVIHIRKRLVEMLTKLDKNLGLKVALGWGITIQEPEKQMNQNMPADGDPNLFSAY